MCKMDLARPCSNCPFLDSEKSISHTLHPGRVQGIKSGLLSDDMTPFLCHKTTSGEEDDSGEYVRSGGEQSCMGSMAWLHNQRRPNVYMRIMASDKKWRKHLEASALLVVK